jgi:hypothetical protein
MPRFLYFTDNFLRRKLSPCQLWHTQLQLLVQFQVVALVCSVPEYPCNENNQGQRYGECPVDPEQMRESNSFEVKETRAQDGLQYVSPFS